MKKILYIFFLLVCFESIEAQLYIDAVPISTKATQLAQSLAGKNITVSNAVLTCHNEASAKFRATNRFILGLDSGIVLTTGKARMSTYWCSPPVPFCLDTVGLNLPSSYHYTNMLGILAKDSLLQKLSNKDTQYDRCKLEFDFIPKGDTVSFNYVFASEEYPKYVCMDVNDVFGLFISGPGISGHKNIALVPNTNMPICINSVFDTAVGASLDTPYFNYNKCTQYGSGSPFIQYFIKNDSSKYLIYNGMTTVLNALSVVTPLSTYHLTFIIADIGDERVDSGIFIEAGSLKSTSMVYATPYSTGGTRSKHPYMIESCGSVRLNFRTPKKLTSSMGINLSYGGSATYGVDYDPLISSFVIPAGDSTYDLYISPKIDALTEPSDSLIIYATNGTTYYDTIVYKIYDQFGGISVFNASNDTTVCNRSQAKLYVRNKDSFVYNVQWSPSTYLDDSMSKSPICTPNVAVGTDTLIYQLHITHTNCPTSLDSIVKVYIKHTPTVMMTKDTLLCRRDTFRFAPIINPSGSYTYTWTPSASLSSSTILTPKAYPSTTTKYVMTLSVPNGCKVKDSTVVNVYDLKPKIDSIRWLYPDCHGANGSISVYLNTSDTNIRLRRNNLNTQWSGIFSNLNDTLHKINISYKNQCQIDTQIKLTRIRPDIQFVETPPTCSNSNGQILANVSNATPPINYLWSNGGNSNVISNLNSGLFTLTITDNQNCKDTLTTHLKALDAPSFEIVSKDAYCTNDNGKLRIKNIVGKKPISFIWSTGSRADSIENLSGGNYAITVTDSIGCAIVYSITLTYYNSPSIAYSAKPVTCITDKGSISISATQGKAPYQYLCSNGSTQVNVTNLSGNQTYKIKVTDANGCVDSTNVWIDSIAKLTASYRVDSAFCSLPNGNIYTNTSQGSPPFSYLWSNGAVTKDNLNISAGTYNVLITDVYNCSTTLANIKVENQIPNLINQTSSQNLKCYRVPTGQVTLDLLGGKPPYLYNFDQQGFSTINSYNSLLAGKYLYTIKDNKGCIYQDSVTILEPTEMVVNSLVIQNASCFASKDGAINLSSSGGIVPHTYLWSNTKTTMKIDSLRRGQYTLTITDQNNCRLIKTYTVNSPDSFNVKAELTHHRCHNDSSGKIVLRIQGGNTPYQFNWSNQSTQQNLSNLVQGMYYLTLTDSKNCSDNFQYEIKTPRLLRFEKVDIKHPKCYGDYNGIVDIYVSGGTEYGYKYAINQGKIQSSLRFSFLSSGIYDVRVHDANDCQIDTIISLINPIRTEVEILPKDTLILIGTSFPMTYHIIKGNKSVKSLLWKPSNGLSCIDCYSPLVSTYASQEYTLIVTDTNNCEAIASSRVMIQDSLVLYIPNAFSPNHDQVNDEFKIYGQYILSSTLSVYNRWGEKVFESNDAINRGWDGQFKGELAPLGIYSYIIEITTLSRKIIKKSGEVMMVR